MRYLSFLLTLIVFAVGCGHNAPPTAQKVEPDYLEYYNSSDRSRIVLLPEGGARFDYIRRDDATKTLRTVLIPTSPPFVDRLLRVVATIDGRALSEPLLFNEMRLSPEPHRELRFSYHGKRQVLPIPAQQAFVFPICFGVINEINRDSGAALGQAIEYYDWAAELESNGNLSEAIQKLNTANQHASEWRNEVPKGLFIDDFEMRFVDFGNYNVEMTASAAGSTAEMLRQKPKDVERAVLAGLKNTWDSAVGNTTTISRKGTVDVVSFSQRDMHIFASGRAASVTPEVLSALNEQRWSISAAQLDEQLSHRVEWTSIK
jgi:hypothetical protein